MSKYFSKFVKYFQDEEKQAQDYVCQCKSKNIENDNTNLEELTSSDSSSSSEQENQNDIINLINENKESPDCSCEEYGSDEEYDEQNDDLCRGWYEDILIKRIELKESIEIQQLVLFHNVQNLLSNQSLLKLHQNKQYLEVTNHIKDPQIILDYINLIWNDLTDPQLLIRHIEILSQINPILVPDFLKSDKYPIVILEITKKYNIQEGSAILYLKQGSIVEALDKLIEFVDDQMRYYVREHLRLPVQIQKKRKSIYQFKSVSQLIGKLQQVLQEINDFLQSKKYLEDMDLLWFKYFHQMIDWQFWLDQLYKLQNTKVELIQLMNFIRVNIPNTVFQLIQSTDIELFVEEYQLSFSKLNIATHIFNFKQITREQKYHKKILKLCFNEIKLTNQMIKEILAVRKSRGRRIQIQCSECSLFGHMIPIDQSCNYNHKSRVTKYNRVLMWSYISLILCSELIILQQLPS